jgi:hypothetical protein
MARDIIIAQFILHVMIVIMWDVVLLPLLFSLGYFIIDDKRSMLSNCRSSMNLMHVSQMNSTFLKESPKTSSLWE